MRNKIRTKKPGGQKRNIKTKFLIPIVAIILGASNLQLDVRAEQCPDLRIVFARGSGEEQNTGQNYLAFKEAIESKLSTASLAYEFIDLDYPAIGIDNLGVAAGAFFGAGEAYEFGDSVKSGVKKLDKMIGSSSCPGTKYVLGGYSQGAMVISRGLKNLDSDRIIYVATFGDPKIYLPEGAGLIPDACLGRKLSDYRIYVPDCHAYMGLLGAYIPYEPEQFAGKIGTWCNKNDIFCSSHFNIDDHVSYVEDDLYEDASRIIFDKITKTFNISNQFYSPHDTAIIIDSTGSMTSLIEKYKAEAYRLAKETFDIGGRVALYDYRDLGDPYQPVEHCNFGTCNLGNFARGLEEIAVDGGGDTPESLLSAAFHVMATLSWQRGATKSLVVLTDAGFLSPDRDGITYAEAVTLSKTIDPVNFYIITTDDVAEEYFSLAEDTGGKVVTEPDDFSLLTDYIIQRYDSLPRVEEKREVKNTATISIDDVSDSGTKVTINFTTDGDQILVILNDKILGITTERTVTIDELDRAKENHIILTPIKNSLRGEGVELELKVSSAKQMVGIEQASQLLPKAPNTGQL